MNADEAILLAHECELAGLPAYNQRCEAVVKNGYEGFALSR